MDAIHDNDHYWLLKRVSKRVTELEILYTEDLYRISHFYLAYE